MRNLGDYSGVLGTWTFDANGDTTLSAVSGWQIQGGEWTFLQIVD
jgi:branched-chain amino acid transport system substrate-binding protein